MKINRRRFGTNFSLIGLAGIILYQIFFSNVNPASGYAPSCMELAGPNQNLENCDFKSGLLSWKDFSGSNLKNADFRGATLNGANFSNADLSGANLFGAELPYVTLRGANLSSTKIGTIGNLGVFIRSGGIIGSPSLPDGWRVIDGFLVGKFVDLKNENLKNISFTDVNMYGADLSFSSLDGAHFENANLTGVNLCGANLKGVSSKNVVAEGSVNSCQNWKLVAGYLVGPQANLSGANLSGANLSGLNLSGVDLSQTNLVRANLENADLTNANLTGADLTGSNLNRAVMFQANITDLKATSIVGVPSELPIGSGLNDGTLAMKLTSTPLPSISGVARTGEKLTVTIGEWDLGTTTKIQWLRDGSPIANASSSQYQLTPNDFGHQISVQITGIKTGYFDGVTISPTVLPTLGKMQTTTPAIAGSFTVGQLLRASIKFWAPDAKVRYQWLIDGKAIKNANTSSYRIVNAQRGHKISLAITQSSVGFQDSKSTSSAYKIR